ncbi:MAG: hypothetical protein ACYS76_09670 [Planctomycetota bacterium]|jgi:3-dehydroquinate synthase class II
MKTDRQIAEAATPGQVEAMIRTIRVLAKERRVCWERIMDLNRECNMLMGKWFDALDLVESEKQSARAALQVFKEHVAQYEYILRQEQEGTVEVDDRFGCRR